MPTRRGALAPPCTIVALALALHGCKKDEPAPGEAAPATATSPETATKAEGEAPDRPAEAGTPPSGDPPTMPVPLAVEYPIALDPLLDLVPAGAQQFGIVRDPEAMLALAHPFAISVMSVLAEAMPEADDRAEIAAASTKYAELRTALAGPELQLGKGMAIVDVGGDPVLVYAATSPTALTSIVAKMAGETDESQCAAVAAAPGYVACAKSAATLAAYLPGMKAAELRADAAAGLPGVDLERANVLGIVSSAHVPFAIETPPGLFQLAVGVPSAALEAQALLVPAPAPALGLLGSDPAFLWMNVSADAVKAQAGGAPAFVTNLIGTFTGEVLVGSLAQSRGVAVLAGVRDPAPVAGLFSLASLQLEALPKELPDGSKLAVTLESIELDGAKTQALHAVLTPSTEASALYGALGMKTEGWAFSAGKYAGAVFGGERDVLEAIATHAAPGPSATTLSALPAALSQAIIDGHAAMAMHTPLDGLASVDGEELLALSGAKAAPTVADAPMDPAQMMRHFTRITAPLSSFSQWVTIRDGIIVGNFAVSVFGDARSEDGKAALDALEQILAGKDAKPLYAALAAAHGGSPRGPSYSARAGELGSSALVSAALVGVLAAIAIPAFQKYIERSKAAAGTTPP
jgi:hypothetical protein